MHISSHILRLALLRVYAEAGVRAGDWLSFLDIGERWTATGLRADDLRAAVHEMIEGGDLLASERGGLLGFALSEAACRGLHQPDGELQSASLEDETTLFLARYRPRTGADTGQRRRQDDNKS